MKTEAPRRSSLRKKHKCGKQIGGDFRLFYCYPIGVASCDMVIP